MPTGKNDQGFWDIPDRDSGAIEPAADPGGGEWNLIDVPIESFFAINMPMGHPMGVFNIDAYKAEYLHHSWLLRLKIDRATPGSGVFKAAGWIMLFREYST